MEVSQKSEVGERDPPVNLFLRREHHECTLWCGIKYANDVVIINKKEGEESKTPNEGKHLINKISNQAGKYRRTETVGVIHLDASFYHTSAFKRSTKNG